MFWSDLIQSRPYVCSASWKKLCSWIFLKKWKVCIDHLFNNLESGKINYCFGKKCGKSLEFWIQKSVRTMCNRSDLFFFFFYYSVLLFFHKPTHFKKEKSTKCYLFHISLTKCYLHGFLSEIKIKHYLLPRRKLLIMLSLDLLIVVCFRVILELHTNYHGGLLKYHSWNSTLFQVCEPLFCYTAVVYVITHCPYHKGVLHDDTNNGCTGEQCTFKTVYILCSWILVIHRQWA